MPTYTVNVDGQNFNVASQEELTPEQIMGHLDSAGIRPGPTEAQSFGGGVARGVAPGIGGFLLGEGGASAGIAAAPETGGLSLLLPAAGAIAGGLFGYAGAKAGQDYLANRFAPGSILSTQAEQRDEQTNPYSSMAGGLVGAGGLPNPASLVRAGESVLTQEGRQVLRNTLAIVRTKGPKAADPKGLELLNNVLHIAGNSGVGVAQGGLEGQNPGDIALNTVGMMLFNEGWLHHPNNDVNTETFRNAVGESEAQNQPGTPPAAQNAPEAVSEPLGGKPERSLEDKAMEELGQSSTGTWTKEQVEAKMRQIEVRDLGVGAPRSRHQAEIDRDNLDQSHEQAADIITNNPAAKVQDQLVEQLATSGAPQTAEVLNQTKEQSRDMDFINSIRQKAEDQADLEQVAKEEQQRITQREQEKQEKQRQKDYEDLLDKARTQKETPAGEAAEGAGEPAPPAQEVIPEDISGTQPKTQPNNEETNAEQEGSQEHGGQVPQGQEGKIVAAAFRFRGRTFEGENHLQAVEKSPSLQKSRLKTRTSREKEGFGFVVQHPDGIAEVVSRQQGNELAQRNGQLSGGPEIVGGNLHSDNLAEGWAKPEDRPTPYLNEVTYDNGVKKFDSKEDFDMAYNQAEEDGGHNRELKETPEEYLLRRKCE